MKKRLAAILLVFALIFGVAPAQSIFAASNNIEDAAVYHTPASDYKSGDCILTASKCMIRRALILRGSASWSSVTNSSMRSSATIFGQLRNSYTYEVGGYAFKVGCGSFIGATDNARIKEFEALMKQHPEGFVVWGSDSSKNGIHGVLVTGVRSGTVYAADSLHNTGSVNKGIQKWTETSMLGPSKVTKYWFIREVGPSDKTSNDVAEATPISKLKIKSYNYPKKLKKGRPYSIKGKVTSNNKLTNVTVKIIDKKGRVKYQAIASPNKKSYKIKKLDKKLKFGKLKKGTYHYVVEASDTIKSKTLVKKKFKVK